MSTNAAVEFLIWVLIAASVIAVLAAWLRIPYTVALVLGGLALGSISIRLPIVETLISQKPDWLTPGVTLVVFLPPLLFEGSLKLQVRQLRENALPVVLLATIGVLVATLVILPLSYEYQRCSRVLDMDHDCSVRHRRNSGAIAHPLHCGARFGRPDTIHLPIAETLITHKPDWLTPSVTLVVFLPALLFEGSLKLQVRHLRENAPPILLLATLGVLATVALVCRKLVIRVPWRQDRHRSSRGRRLMRQRSTKFLGT